MLKVIPCQGGVSYSASGGAYTISCIKFNTNNNMADIGKYNTLTVLEKSDHGLYLNGGEHDRILMPTRYVFPR